MKQEKAIKIAALTIITAVTFCIVYHVYFDIWGSAANTALTMLLSFVFFASAGELVACVFKNSFEKYVMTNIVLALIIIPDSAVFAVLAACDFSYPEMILPGIRATLLWNLLIFGVPASASIVFGRFVIHKKKRRLQPSEAND